MQDLTDLTCTCSDCIDSDKPCHHDCDPGETECACCRELRLDAEAVKLENPRSHWSTE